MCISHDKGEETKVVTPSVFLKEKYRDVSHSTLFFILFFQIVLCMSHYEVIHSEIVLCVPNVTSL